LLSSVAPRKIFRLTYSARPARGTGRPVSVLAIAERFSVGIASLAEVLRVTVTDDVCDREGARIFVLGCLAF
jgi:hypothetical protein